MTHLLVGLSVSSLGYTRLGLLPVSWPLSYYLKSLNWHQFSPLKKIMSFSKVVLVVSATMAVPGALAGLPNHNFWEKVPRVIFMQIGICNPLFLDILWTSLPQYHVNWNVPEHASWVSPNLIRKNLIPIILMLVVLTMICMNFKFSTAIVGKRFSVMFRRE